MLFSKVDNVSRLIQALAEIVNIEIFWLVDNKELTHSCHEPSILIKRTFECALRIEIEPAPTNLHDWVFAGLVPDRDWR
jgi:hypothetical protein